MSHDPNPTPIAIRALSTLEEFRQTEHVQRMAWAMADSAQVVPAHVTLTAQKNGGLVAGAFDPSGAMLGFVFGFVGLAPGGAPGKLKHCSHLLGVLPEARHLHLGYRLKRFQRDYVRRQGIDLITWTYDPLEGRNAMLNIAKLGGVVGVYHLNLYGELSDGINAGIPSDRFEVAWWIHSAHVQAYIDAVDGNAPRQRPTLAELAAAGARPALIAQFNAAGLPEPIPGGDVGDASACWVEVPADYQRVKGASLALAREWRLQTRAVFTELFGRGYRVVDFLSVFSGAADATRRNSYVLRRDWPDLPDL